ncbi:hypothetical protein [[Eubacterium] hominis]|uniref:hypothetical protein n=1 Tax=[Eubacterium] hominis TaxID=2764325 RepID=UPI0022DF1850
MKQQNTEVKHDPNLVQENHHTIRKYEDEDYEPAPKGIVPKTNCKRSRVAYVDHEFHKNKPFAELLK